MRIILAVPTLDIGGAESQLVRLAVELSRRGHDVTVFVVGWVGPLQSELAEAGVPVVVVDALSRSSALLPASIGRLPPGLRRVVALPTKPVRSMADAWRRMRVWRRLWALQPDVVHAFLPTAERVVLPAAALAGVPVRLAGRRSLSRGTGLRPRPRRLSAVLNRSIHAAVANSEAVAVDIARHERPPPPRVVVIPNGVDLPPTTADVGRCPAVGVVVANLNSWKGHADLVAALAGLPDPPTVRLVGDGPERPSLEAAVADAGLGDKIRFEGSVRRAAGSFLDAQFAVLPSHREGMPNAVLEAMAAGVPTVATDVGGVRSLIAHEVDGLVVPVRSPSALGRAVERLASDPDLRRRLGSAARERAAHFTWSACAQHHEDLYSALLSSAGRRGAWRRRVVTSLVPSVAQE